MEAKPLPLWVSTPAKASYMLSFKYFHQHLIFFFKTVFPVMFFLISNIPTNRFSPQKYAIANTIDWISFGLWLIMGLKPTEEEASPPSLNRWLKPTVKDRPNGHSLRSLCLRLAPQNKI
jgi:hypothetical protein